MNDSITSVAATNPSPRKHRKRQRAARTGMRLIHSFLPRGFLRCGCCHQGAPRRHVFRYRRMHICELCTHKWKITQKDLYKLDSEKKR